MNLQPRNSGLLERLEPFLVATPENCSAFDLQPFGVPIAASHRFDPLRLASGSFLRLLSHLDEASFGRTGMPMPHWMFLDGGELSGGIVGFAKSASGLSKKARMLLRVPDGHEGPVPLSMYVALPSFAASVWIGHNLCSVAGKLADEGLSGLGSLTKAFALKVFRAAVQIGASQWDSNALYVHTKLAPLEIMTAWTPAHTKPWTLTYRARVDEPALLHLAGDPRGKISCAPPAFWIDSDDHAAMEALQAKVEANERHWVVGPPEAIGDGRRRLPIARDA